MSFARAGLILLSAVFSFEMAMAQEDVSSRLLSVGFTMRAADTAQKQDRLGTLPPRRFVMRQKGGVPYYLYADPTSCRCVYVGNQRAMNSYREVISQLPPGYLDFAGTPATGGDRRAQIESDMLQDMDHDAGLLDAGDILHPGF